MPEYDCINQKIIGMENKLQAAKETLDSHRDTLEQHNRRLSDMANSLHENTALTQQIADNTGEMVRIFTEAKVVFKWGAIAKKFIVWFASVTAALLYFWDYIVEWARR